jgi:hypothetical protein
VDKLKWLFELMKIGVLILGEVCNLSFLSCGTTLLFMHMH